MSSLGWGERGGAECVLRWHESCRGGAYPARQGGGDQAELARPLLPPNLFSPTRARTAFFGPSKPQGTGPQPTEPLQGNLVALRAC